jgi:hypothetical protein
VHESPRALNRFRVPIRFPIGEFAHIRAAERDHYEIVVSQNRAAMVLLLDLLDPLLAEAIRTQHSMTFLSRFVGEHRRERAERCEAPVVPR